MQPKIKICKKCYHAYAGQEDCPLCNGVKNGIVEVSLKPTKKKITVVELAKLTRAYLNALQDFANNGGVEYFIAHEKAEKALLSELKEIGI